MNTRLVRANVLVVDDDPTVARALIDAFELADYGVWHAASGGEARRQLERAEPDLIVLELMLPDVDGLVLCALLRSVTPVPIVVCSASRRRSDPVLSLKLGADDYVHKPFEVDDLLARVEAVLRRQPPQGVQGAPRSTELRVGALLVEPGRRRVSLAGELLPLTPTEFRLITALAAQAEQVISREQLAQAVWGCGDACNGRTIDVHVRRLRIKFGRFGVRAPALISVRSLGYKLSASETATTAA